MHARVHRELSSRISNRFFTLNTKLPTVLKQFKSQIRNSLAGNQSSAQGLTVSVSNCKFPSALNWSRQAWCPGCEHFVNIPGSYKVAEFCFSSVPLLACWYTPGPYL